MIKEILVVAVLLIGSIFCGMYGIPKYRVWSAEQKGKAQFAEAEQNRRIKIEEAKANLEAEKLNAQGEIERAKGAAEAIRIENGSITPEYILHIPADTRSAFPVISVQSPVSIQCCWQS